MKNKNKKLQVDIYHFIFQKYYLEVQVLSDNILYGQIFNIIDFQSLLKVLILFSVVSLPFEILY